MAARKNRINLLPKEEFATTTVGRVLTWLLSTFRYIVIATEMVVMVAFISRFWLDAKHTDLKDEIKQKQSIITASAAFEKEFKATQTKLAAFSSLASGDNSYFSVLDATTSYAPTEVALKSLSISPTDVQIGGIAVSERAVAQYIANLENTKLFEKVELTKVSSDVSLGGTLEFILSANLAKKI